MSIKIYQIWSRRKKILLSLQGRDLGLNVKEKHFQFKEMPKAYSFLKGVFLG